MEGEKLTITLEEAIRLTRQGEEQDIISGDIDWLIEGLTEIAEFQKEHPGEPLR